MSRLSVLAGDSGNLAERVTSLPAAGTNTATVEINANKLTLVGFATTAVTIKLPQAIGSGDVYRFLNTVTRTSGALTFQLVNTASTFNALIESLDSAAAATHTSAFFSTNATQIALNITTSGGLGGDYFEFIDGAAGQWYVRGYTRCSGANSTPLS